MPPVRDPYAVLDVSPGASAAEVRRAYRLASLRAHPDKVGGSAAAFAEVADAYRALAGADAASAAAPAYVPTRPDDPFADDAYRRQFADAFAQSCAKEGHPMRRDEVFEALFGRTRAGYGHTPGADGGDATCDADDDGDGDGDVDGDGAERPPDRSVPARKPRRRMPGEAVTLEVPRGEVFGARAEPMAEGESADGAQEEEMWKPPDKEVELPLTLAELFTGCVKKHRMRRRVIVADTGAYEERAEVLSVHVRRGYRAGDRVRFREAADHGHGCIPADVVFVIAALPHPRFSVVAAADLRMIATVTLAEALSGTVLHVQNLVGETFPVRVADVVTPGQVRRVKGRGMPRTGDDAHGDLLIQFHVTFPVSLTPAEKKTVRTALGPVFAREESNENASEKPAAKVPDAGADATGRAAAVAAGMGETERKGAESSARALPLREARGAQEPSSVRRSASLFGATKRSRSSAQHATDRRFGAPAGAPGVAGKTGGKGRSVLSKQKRDLDSTQLDLGRQRSLPAGAVPPAGVTRSPSMSSDGNAPQVDVGPPVRVPRGGRRISSAKSSSASSMCSSVSARRSFLAKVTRPRRYGSSRLGDVNGVDDYEDSDTTSVSSKPIAPLKVHEGPKKKGWLATFGFGF